MKLRLGTRKSALAMWQANHLKGSLESMNPGLEVELVKITTTGDRFLSRPLDDVASRETGVDKGFFTKELEEKLIAKEIDAAIHSLKDLPTVLPGGLKLGAVSKREEVADIFITSHKLSMGGTLGALPRTKELKQKLRRDIIVGTASQRRIAQLGELFPGTKAGFIRGNVDTRIKKLISKEFDIIMLAEAGLKRLSGKELFKDSNTFEARLDWNVEGKDETLHLYRLSPDLFLPSCSQGFLGVEIREEDPQIESVIMAFHDVSSLFLALAERAFLRTLEAGCHAPVAGYAMYSQKETISLSGKVLSRDGQRKITGEKFLKIPMAEPLELLNSGFDKDAEKLGVDLATELLDNGAQDLLS